MEPPDNQTFFCRGCGREYPRQFFSVDRSRASRRSKYCRACESAKFRAWYQENRAKVISRVRKNRSEKAKLVIRIGKETHDLDGEIDGKSPLRVFFELLQPIEAEEHETNE